MPLPSDYVPKVTPEMIKKAASGKRLSIEAEWYDMLADKLVGVMPDDELAQSRAAFMREAAGRLRKAAAVEIPEED